MHLEAGLGFIVSKVVGHFSDELAAQMCKECSAVIARDREVFVYHDWGQMTSYDSLARARLTRWAISNRTEAKTVTIWTSSSLVRMGVATASLALSLVGIHVTTCESAAQFASLVAAVRAGKKQANLMR